jgi:hypothetical protein
MANICTPVSTPTGSQFIGYSADFIKLACLRILLRAHMSTSEGPQHQLITQTACGGYLPTVWRAVLVLGHTVAVTLQPASTQAWFIGAAHCT